MEECAMDVDLTTNDQTHELTHPASTQHLTKKDETPALEPLLALHKIESVTSSGSSTSFEWIVFSAIGYVFLLLVIKNAFMDYYPSPYLANLIVRTPSFTNSLIPALCTRILLHQKFE